MNTTFPTKVAVCVALLLGMLNTACESPPDTSEPQRDATHAESAPSQQATPQVPEPTVWHVYLLAGQSNMVGYGFTNELTDAQRQPVDGVFIYVPNHRGDRKSSTPEAAWMPLRPGFGTGYHTHGTHGHLSRRFGPEIGFAREMRRQQPDQLIAIIKCAKGGTAIDIEAGRRNGSWDPKASFTNQFDHAIATIRAALDEPDFDGDGTVDAYLPVGIAWMQGESDTHQTAAAQSYFENLSNVMTGFRAEFDNANLPIVLGRISDSQVKAGTGRLWQFGELVRAAQVAFAEHDPNAAIVLTTDEYGYTDRAHYDTAGYLDLGKQMARELLALQSESRVR